MALGTHDITHTGTESIALSCHAPHQDREGRNLEQSQHAIVVMGYIRLLALSVMAINAHGNRGSEHGSYSYPTLGATAVG
jgi:hypothetical protein